MPPQQLEAKTLSNMAYEAIKDSILKNEMLPGQEVVISSVAASLGISHIPVREAVARLAAAGFIEQAPHRTLRVAGLDEDTVRQVYEVRRLLEPHAAAAATEQATRNPVFRERVFALLHRAQEITQTDPEKLSLEELVAIDLKLNELFLEAVENKLLRELLILIGNRSLRIRTYSEATASATSPEAVATGTREHVAIIRSILDGDENRSKKLAFEHLCNSEARTMAAMKARTGA